MSQENQPAEIAPSSSTNINPTVDHPRPLPPLRVVINNSRSTSTSTSTTPSPSSSKPRSRRPTLPRSPSSILETDSLFLTSTPSPILDDHLLYKLRVTHILSLLPPYTSLGTAAGVRAGGRVERRIHVPEGKVDEKEGNNGGSNIMDLLSEAVDWLDEVFKDRGAVVMVYGSGGIGEVVVVAWVVRRRRWSWGWTEGWVRDRRGGGGLGDEWRGVGEAWEREVFGDNKS